MHIRSVILGFTGLLIVSGVGSPIVAVAQLVEPQLLEPKLSEPLWLSEISTCEQLKGEIRARFGAVSDLAKLEEPKRSEMEVVINVACSARFAGCRFKVCRERTSAAGASSPSQSSQANFSEQLSSLRAAAASVAGQIELAPLSSASSGSDRLLTSESSSSVTSDLFAASSSVHDSSQDSSQDSVQDSSVESSIVLSSTS